MQPMTFTVHLEDGLDAGALSAITREVQSSLVAVGASKVTIPDKLSDTPNSKSGGSPSAGELAVTVLSSNVIGAIISWLRTWSERRNGRQVIIEVEHSGTKTKFVLPTDPRVKWDSNTLLALVQGVASSKPSNAK